MIITIYFSVVANDKSKFKLIYHATLIQAKLNEVKKSMCHCTCQIKVSYDKIVTNCYLIESIIKALIFSLLVGNPYLFSFTHMDVTLNVFCVPCIAFTACSWFFVVISHGFWFMIYQIVYNSTCVTFCGKFASLIKKRKVF